MRCLEVMMRVGIKIALEGDGRVLQNFSTHVPNYSVSVQKTVS